MSIPLRTFRNEHIDAFNGTGELTGSYQRSPFINRTWNHEYVDDSNSHQLTYQPLPSTNHQYTLNKLLYNKPLDKYSMQYRHPHYRYRSVERAHGSDKLNQPLNSNANYSPMTTMNGWDSPKIGQHQGFMDHIEHIIGNQDKNLKALKNKLDHSKAKIANDFQVLKTQLSHILEDARLSVQAQFDKLYKNYITKYAILKGQLHDFHIQKSRIVDNYAVNRSAMPLSATATQDPIVQKYINAEIYNQLTLLESERIPNINLIINDIALIGKQSSFYSMDQLNIHLKDIRSTFNQCIHQFYHIIPSLIFAPTAISQNVNESIFRQLEAPIKDRTPMIPVRQFDDTIHSPRLGGSVTKVAQSQQVLVANGDFENISMKIVKNITTDHNESILCIRFIADRYIATGSKDQTINVYTLDGQKVACLRGHSAAICCLSSVRSSGGQNYLMSGSDYGCSSVVKWDTRQWTQQAKMPYHKAAVTSIVDMEDSTHCVTGSFDKKICLINHNNSQLVATYSTNESSVTAMALSTTGQLLLSACMDNSLILWTVRRSNQTVISLEQLRTIKINSFICQLQASILRPSYFIAANKDGCIISINAKTGNIDSSVKVNQSSIIELAVIERQKSPTYPLILSCSSKDNYLQMTQTNTNRSQLLDIGQMLAIQYGCGIGPKIIFNDAKLGLMAVVSQTNSNRAVTIYQIGLM